MFSIRQSAQIVMMENPTTTSVTRRAANQNGDHYKLIQHYLHGRHKHQGQPRHLHRHGHAYQQQTHHLLRLVNGNGCSAGSLKLASNSGSQIRTTLGYASTIFGGGSKPAATALSLFEDGHSLLRHGHEHHLSLGDNLGSPHGLTS